MTRIESVDAFYLAMPEVLDVGDGSQDMMLIRVRSGDLVGWGECEAAPLPTIASLVCPMSHSACHPVLDSVLGETVDDVADIERIARRVRARSLDLLQAAHALSGVEIALWDLLGKRRGEPVHALLGFRQTRPRTAYGSVLFGDTAEQTYAKAKAIRERGLRAAKFGWGPYGTGDARDDADQVHAAHEGLGPGAALLVDAGTVWGEDVGAARLRLPALRDAGVLWLEEPFVSGALAAYRELAAEAGPVRLAGGEGAHDFHMARNMVDHAGIGFVQVDTGRIGGIAEAYRVAQYAQSHGVGYVNHTFTSHLALSASLQPYAGSADDWLCEYPLEAKPLATSLTRTHLQLRDDGTVLVPDGPGLGIELDLAAVRPYLRDVEIVVDGKVLYRTPDL
jgi:L-alanine-DL-glutamate epimerase-like enolase superfamily enzyme